MADDFKKLDTEFRDLGKTLSKIQENYSEEIKDAIKQTNKLSGGWMGIQKHITDTITGAKKIALLEKEINAGKNKSKELDGVIDRGLKNRKLISDQLQTVQEEMNKVSAGMGEAALPAMTDAERDRFNFLKKQKNSLEDQAILQGKQIRDAIKQRSTQNAINKTQEEELEKREKNLNYLQLALGVLKKTADIIVEIIKLGDKYDKMLMKFANDLGVGRIEAEKYIPTLEQSVSEMQELGATTIDATKAASDLVGQFELVAVAGLKEINKQMLLLNKAFGVSLEDSAKFYSTLTQVGNASLESQTNMTAVADQAAKAAGVPLGKVIKDVANTTESVRLIFRGNTEQLIKQVAEARKLGTNLDSAAKSAESLLNFETSIGAELKLSALLGKNVNFNEARRLFFAGKALEAEKAILAELNKIGDINDLNYIQRKALVDATGKTIGELQKMQAQTKQQLSLDAKFPALAEERRKHEEKLSQLLGDENKQREHSLEMQARDNIANARANVYLAQKEQILINLSRALQPFYRVITYVSEAILGLGVKWSQAIANFSAANPKLGSFAAILSIVGVSILGIAAAIGTLRLAFRGLSAVGIEVSAFLIELGIGLAAFGVGGALAVPIVLSLAAGLAAVGVALWGLGEAFKGLGSLIKSILEPFVKYVEVIVSGFNTFVANIGPTMVKVGEGLKTITDIGFSKLTRSAAGVAAMAVSIGKLSSSLASLPIDKLTGFASNISSITNANMDSFSKLSEIFKTASDNNGKLMIGIEDAAVTSINKLSELKGEKEELKQVIREGNERLVKSVEALTNLMSSGGIAVNLDGQRLTAALSRTTYRSGGLGQATTLG